MIREEVWEAVEQMNQSPLWILKLRELQLQIPTLKKKGVACYNTPEFRIWHTSLVKWLKAGGSYTADELANIEYKSYVVPQARVVGQVGYSAEDAKVYQDELDITSHLIDSAIENIRLGLNTRQLKAPSTPQKIRDQYNIAQAGAVGPGAYAHDMTLNQIQPDALNLPRLTEELSTLRTALKRKASQPEHDIAIGAIAEAEIAAKQGDGSRVMESLRKAGQWTWGVATEIGTTLAAEVLKKTMGL